MAVFSCDCLGDDLPSNRELNKYKTLLCACSFFRNLSVFIASRVGCWMMLRDHMAFRENGGGGQSPLSEYREGGDERRDHKNSTEPYRGIR